MFDGGATIFGASGFIGTRLVRRLAVAGRGPIVAVDICEPRERMDGVTYVDADVRRPLDRSLASTGGTIFNFAAVHRTPGHPPHEYYDTNVHGALNVCALATAAKARQLVFTSSISVYGPSETTLTEASPIAPISDYGRSKAMAEVIHRDWLGTDTGRRLVVVRPAVVFGPGERGNYTRLARALERGYFVYPGRRSTVKSGGYVDELLLALEFAISRPQVYTLFNFAFPTLSSTEDIVAGFSGVRGRRYAPATLPLGPVLAGCHIAHKIFGASTFHPDRIMKLVQSTRVAPGWLTGSGYRFTYDLERALSAWSQETEGRFE